MASSSSRKRCKTITTQKGKAKVDQSASLETYFSHRFRTEDCSNRFTKKTIKRTIIPDINLKITGEAFPEIRENINIRSWEDFVGIAGQGYQNLTYEFYANAWKAKSEEWPDSVSYVRGAKVPFDAATINKVLHIVQLEESAEDSEYNQFLRGDIDYTKMLRVLCRPGALFKEAATLEPKSLKMGDLKPIPKAWYHFIIGSIVPLTDYSEVCLERAKLLYGIVTGLEMNVGEVINTHMRKVLNNKSSSLPYPSLITLLCVDAGVDVEPTDILVCPRKPIDNMRIERFQWQYNEKLGQPPQQQPQRAGNRYTSTEHFRAIYKGMEVINRNIQLAVAGILMGVLHNMERLEDLIQNHQSGRPETGKMPLTCEQVMNLIQFEDLPPNPFNANNQDGTEDEEDEDDEENEDEDDEGNAE